MTAKPPAERSHGRSGRNPATEFESRRATVSAGLAARKLDALLVAFSPNLRYLTGFTGSHGCLLIEPERATLFTDPRYRAQAAQETTARVKISKGALVVDILAAIARRGLKRVGYEPARMTCDLFESLGARLPMKASLAPARGWIENLRMLKSPQEIACIRRSVETNSRAFEAGVRRVRPGMMERDLAAELEYRMRRLGADKPAFETIVAGGARSALPHAQPTAAPLSPGSLVVVDMGAFEDGYASDMTRMLFVGRPGARVKRTYRAVLEAQLTAIASVRPGVVASQVDRAARQVLKGYGLDGAFAHSTGHGLGLEIHEPPRIGMHGKTVLREGMAITIEPGVYLDGFGGIRIEDTVLVTANGCEILTPTSKELRVI